MLSISFIEMNPDKMMSREYMHARECIYIILCSAQDRITVIKVKKIKHYISVIKCGHYIAIHSVSVYYLDTTRFSTVFFFCTHATVYDLRIRFCTFFTRDFRAELPYFQWVLYENVCQSSKVNAVYDSMGNLTGLLYREKMSENKFEDRQNYVTCVGPSRTE